MWLLDVTKNSDLNADFTVSCVQLIWSYKHNLTVDFRFDSAASEICEKTLVQVKFHWQILLKNFVYIFSFFYILCYSNFIQLINHAYFVREFELKVLF